MTEEYQQQAQLQVDKDSSGGIRPITLQDAAAIRDIAAVSLGYPESLELVQDQIRTISQLDDHWVFVYEDRAGGQVLGFIEGQIYRSVYSSTGVNVLGLAVLPDYQARGIGKQLIQHLEDYARKQGLAYVRLNSGKDRTGAHAFYDRQGYDGSKLQKRFIKDLN